MGNNGCYVIKKVFKDFIIDMPNRENKPSPKNSFYSRDQNFLKESVRQRNHSC